MMLDPILITKSEAEIVTLLFQGQKVDEIAAVLGVTDHAVKMHLCRVYKKAGVSSSIGLVAKAWKNGGFLY